MTQAQWHRWHRTAGIIVAVFVVFLGVTGIFINHTGQLGLDRRYVESEWILNWYDIKPPEPPVAYPVAGHWVTRIADRVYFDHRQLAERASGLLGAVAGVDLIVIALEDQLLLVTEGGELVEILRSEQGVPAGMRAIGARAAGEVVIRAAHGDYRPDFDTLDWKQHSAGAVSWSQPARLPAALRDELLRAYRGTGLSLERVLLDLHSGRILGAPGVVLVDLVTLALLFLAGSGAWMWLHRR